VSGVRIKPLKWQDGGLNDLVAKTQFGGEWRIRELPRYLPWELTVHDMDGEHVDCRTLDEAKAAAQADYEARIRASITSEATPIAGENE
jgi:hypothetical protein